MNAYSTTFADLSRALSGKPLVDAPVAPTVADLVKFVRSHPMNPYQNIGCGLIGLDIEYHHDLAATKLNLQRRYIREGNKIRNKHWSADGVKFRVCGLLVELIEEFEATAPEDV